MSRLLKIVAVLVSGTLLFCAFPPVNDGQCAWLALVPLLLLACYSVPASAFRWGYLAGLLYWLLTLSWLLSLGRTGTHVCLAGLGWVALAFYSALYTSVFCGVCSWLMKRFTKRCLIVLLVPVLWVGLEYTRCMFLSGFPWNPLGVSQYRNLSVIQVAEWGGVYAVSAVVAIMNASLAMTVIGLVEVYMGREKRRGLRIELMIGLMACALCWMHGARRVLNARRYGIAGDEIRIAAVQPNTPQVKKWNPAYESAIYERLRNQTKLASINSPGLIVWPETAVMRPLNTDELTMQFVQELAVPGSPILVGAMEKLKNPNPCNEYDTWYFYNSSFLVGAEGEVRGVYRKQHLVPFGEYIPLENIFTFLKRFIPLGYSCAAGKDSTILTVRSESEGAVKQLPFSVLICFEDVFPALTRKAVLAGARFMVNQTNDAWFDGTCGPVQHVSHCVFRAVENRVPIVRSANTGVTCFIDRLGVLNRFSGDSDPNGLGIEGFKVAGLMVPDDEYAGTMYSDYGDWLLAVPCTLILICILLWMGYSAYEKSSREKAHDR